MYKVKENVFYISRDMDYEGLIKQGDLVEVLHEGDVYKLASEEEEEGCTELVNVKGGDVFELCDEEDLKRLFEEV